MSQGNLYSYLKQIKMSFVFSFTKSEQEDRTGPAWEAVGNSGRQEEVGKGCRKVNMVQILCIHGCKWKNETC
jgi:hypothetical protein